jgi:cytochrome c556
VESLSQKFLRNFSRFGWSAARLRIKFSTLEKKTMKFAASLVLAAAGFVLAAPASAQFAKPEDAVKYRQSALFVMAQHFGRIGAMANGRVPFDGKAATENAEIVSEMSKLPWHGFGAGTDKVSVPTRAKPEVWSEPAKFKEGQDKLVDATGKLLAAAKTNNLDNLKAAFQNTAGTCKACHDVYRKD